MVRALRATTPLAMGVTLQRLLLGDALAPAGREQLQAWLKGNTTGDARIRAGVPKGWIVGDKPGSGDYGVANDVGIVWPQGRAPWILVVFSRGPQQSSPWNHEPIAAVTRLVVQAWQGWAPQGQGRTPSPPLSPRINLAQKPKSLSPG